MFSGALSHEMVLSLAGPGHIADGSLWQDFGGGVVAQRESQDHGQAPDAHNDASGCLCRQTRLQGMDDGHVPAQYNEHKL